MIIAFNAEFTIIIQPDELTGILVDLDFRHIALIRVMRLDDAYHQLSITYVLDDLAGIPVKHIVFTAATRLHHKFVLTV